MFDGTSTFNQPLDSWDVPLVSDMEFMFYGATAFNQDLCKWGLYYAASGVNYADMFDANACPDKRDPTSAAGPWCKASCSR